MKKYKVRVAIVGSKDLGIMEAEDEIEISKKVIKEGISFEGISDDVIDTLDLGVDEVFIEEV